MKRKINAFLLAALMVVSLVIPSMAAGTAPELALAGEQNANQTVVTVDLTGEGATNGRIIVTYDAGLVTLVSAQAADGAWTVSIDSSAAGRVAFAWAGSSLAEGETQVLTLVFQDSNGQNDLVTYTAELTELYDNGADLLAGETVTAELAFQETFETVVTPFPPVGPGTGDPGTEDPGTEDPGVVVENPFTDIDGHWAYDYILKAYRAGLVNGTSASKFSPEMAVTRGMFVTMLYRMEGSPAVTGVSPYVDVSPDEYYADAVTWAYQTGVTKGTSATTFAPDATATRQELVTMLYRYAQLTGGDTSARASLDAFPDSGDVDTWARTAMEWAVGDGIIQGANGLLIPKTNTTRAQTATILVRYAGL